MSGGSGWHSLSSLWLTCQSSHRPSAACNSRLANSQPCLKLLVSRGQMDQKTDLQIPVDEPYMNYVFLQQAVHSPRALHTVGTGPTQGIAWVFLNGIIAWPQKVLLSLDFPYPSNSRENRDLLRSRSLSYQRAFSNCPLLSPPWVPEG